MEVNQMKNMIVLRELPSNMIEEAFFVLKGNVKVHTKQEVTKKEMSAGKEKKKLEQDNYMVKEAELIVKEYIHNLEKGTQKKERKKLEQTCKKWKSAAIFFGSLSAAMIIRILLGM